VLIVVVIMAILAATIIPQFANSATDAKVSSLKFNLHSLRSQIELYRMQHNGIAPAIDGTTNTLEQLLRQTDASGNIGTGAAYPFGPYVLNQVPENPITGYNTIRAFGGGAWPGTATADGTGGWVYDAATGRIAADHPDYINE
jgi:type II secretory pathway pseudopilin PulG